MKTIKQVEIRPIFHSDFLPPFETFKDGEIHISEKYYTSIHRCLCGCGEQTVLPFNHGDLRNTGWDLIKHSDEKISITPSVGNYQIPCKSHYIITKNKANFV